MYRIDNATSVAQMPTPSAAGTGGYFTGGNAATGQPATRLAADWFNLVQETLIHPIAYLGLALSKTDFSQLTTAIRALGLIAPYDATFAAAIGGYPLGAHVIDASGIEWVSTAAKNLTTPGGTDASWKSPTAGYALLSTVSQIASRWFTSASNSVTVPSWATRMRYQIVGGGGAGATCIGSSTADSVWAGGGGAGAFVEDIIPVVAGKTVQVTIGAGAAPDEQTTGAQNNGGNTTLTYDGNIVAIAGGGNGANWTSGSKVNCAGGRGGQPTVSIGSSPNAAYGNDGSDGQAGTVLQGGDGAGGPWGGAGRCGDAGGYPGRAPGAGGGGAKDTAMSGTKYYGGAGADGCAIIEWMP
ncbi:hypothetical protein AA103196_2262 [Ameyamaea chiangmaiensis NBRC 103196]|uniref:Glycine-rich domain-containing protein n=1 Tax=Ameyamaea chiangmaiensis TaxID=442969 RepID=A0A850P8I0_9PROT|nr:hypothetical protein [Ameyamaea chiangmaiensis]MBS4075479.1 hypothetical protein [Ameyamaea chiangmaiensis]NVN38989.1 hypothetical protein [Ameyamaea chiangmaiensis]GBQ69618.1 hypothetical protein AA103196_2262 [Ameyamaea chiangmaiensis NBRC 103196]